MYFKTNISPMCAFTGGIVAQEIIKRTGKYTPINQWLHIDFFECLPDEKDSIDITPLNSR